MTRNVQQLQRLLTTYVEVTHRNPDPIDELTKRQYRRAICAFADLGDPAISGFDKTALIALCDHLGEPVQSSDTTRTLRRKIANTVGVEYSSPDSNIRDFRKDELARIAFHLAENNPVTIKVERSESEDVQPAVCWVRGMNHGLLGYSSSVWSCSSGCL